MADDLEDVDETVQDEIGVRRCVLAADHQYAHDAAHEEFVLLKLHGLGALLDQEEELSDHVLGAWKIPGRAV